MEVFTVQQCTHVFRQDDSLVISPKSLFGMNSRSVQQGKHGFMLKLTLVVPPNN